MMGRIICSSAREEIYKMFGTKYLNDEHDCNVVSTNSMIDRTERIVGWLRQETLCYLVAGLFERDHLHPTPPTD